MVRLWLSALAIFAATEVQAGCNQITLPETPQVLLRAYSNRMEQVGAPNWLFATKTARGDMYYSKSTGLRFIMKEIGGLTEEVGLLLPDPATADNTRLEVAAAFLGSHLSGSTESAFQARIVKAISETRKDREAHQVREGETVLMFSSPTPNAVAVIAGRLRCE